MLLLLFGVLLIVWVLGGFVFRVAGAMIHLVLILALIALVMHFLRG